MPNLKVRLFSMTRYNLVGFIISCWFLLCSAGASSLNASESYHLIRKVPFGAAEGGGEYFDYITVDSTARRVYLSHGTEVKVLDADHDTVIGTILGLKKCHGVAIVSDLNRGFISDGELGQVVIFDLKTLKTVGHVKTDAGSDSILYDPTSKRVFVFNGGPHSATVIDPVNETVVGTIPLGGAPEQAVADGSGMIYDNLKDTNEVIAIDSRSLRITSRWRVFPGGQPVAIAMDREHRRLFIGCRDPKLFLVMNADNGRTMSKPIAIGNVVDGNVYDSATGTAASATRDGAIYIFHEDSPDKFSLVETVKTEFGAKTMALDPKTHNLLVDTSDFEIPAGRQKQPNPQPKAKPGTFRLLIYGR